MARVPSAVWVIDTKKEHIAVNEARKLGIPVVAILDTNCDPDEVTYPIPGNDDAIRSVALLTRVVADAVADGLIARASAANGDEKPAAGVGTEEPLAEWEREILEGHAAADPGAGADAPAASGAENAEAATTEAATTEPAATEAATTETAATEPATTEAAEPATDAAAAAAAAAATEAATATEAAASDGTASNGAASDAAATDGAATAETASDEATTESAEEPAAASTTAQ
jgi:small subunit ribosomal protein S2